MTYSIYYRKSLMDADELTAASKYFSTTDLITNIKPDEFVVPRFSLFPYPYDVERDIVNLGAKIINTYKQHAYVADLQNYVYDLKELTPLTWDRPSDLPEGQFVLKGQTNSKKSHWLKSMFAPSKTDAIRIYSELMDDMFLQDQEIYIRQYVPLVKLLDGVNGMPVTKEFRFFVAYGEVISGAFYWQNYADDLESIPSAEEVPKSFLDEIIKRVGHQINFFVVDVAQTQDGNWIVIELNDGCYSGLSCNDPDVLYKNLKAAILKNN